MTDKNYDYVVYIDEAGDEGLRKIKPIDDNGSSEWLMLSATVISAKYEEATHEWVQKILYRFNNKQITSIHFRNLGAHKKRIAAQKIGSLPIRNFVVASNKKNMRQYNNDRAERVPSRNWFYCWMTRLLLERVTHFVKERSLQDFGCVKKIKIIYSHKGGHSYSQMSAYYRYIKSRPLYLKQGQIHWETIDFDLIEALSYKEIPGLQISDVVVSSFNKACDVYCSGGCDTQYAELLMPRMARHPDTYSGRISGYGLKLMPHSLQKAELLPEQEKIFRISGYPLSWWAQSSNDSEAFRAQGVSQVSW